MLQPIKIKEMFQHADDLIEMDFATILGKLSGAGLNKVFKSSDRWREETYKEMIFEFFGPEKFGPKDIKELFSGFIHDQTIIILNEVSNIVEPVSGAIENSFVYIDGTMEEIAKAMEFMGIDIPEGLDLIPGASELVIGVSLLLDIKAVNKEFQGISSDKKKNIAAAKVLVTISKFGVTLTLTSIGGAAGGVGGVAIGGVGAVIGAPIGAISGSIAARYINKMIVPHSQEIAYKLLKLEKEDLFYYKNKQRIDGVGIKLMESRKYIESLEFK